MPLHPSQTEQILNDAVARNAGAILSLPSSGAIENIKSRFLAHTDEGVWFQIGFKAIADVAELIESKESLAVSFKITRRRVTFPAQVLRVDTAFQLNEKTVVPGLLIGRPDEIDVTQRRSAYRAPVTRESGFSVRAWLIEDGVYLGNRPQPSKELKIIVIDASVGGVGIRIPRQREGFPEFTTGQRVRVQVEYQGLVFLLDGRLRFKKQNLKGSFLAGITFKRQDDNVEGRQKLAALTRIVGNLQQEEMRRNRLSAA